MGFDRFMSRENWVASAVAFIAGGAFVVVSVLVWSLGARMGDYSNWIAGIGALLAVAFAAWQVRDTREDARKAIMTEQAHTLALQQREFEEAAKRWTMDRLIELLKALEAAAQQTLGSDGHAFAMSDARALVAALPSEMATIAAYQLGIPGHHRAHDTESPHPVDLWMEERFRYILRKAPRLEVTWNILAMQGNAPTESPGEYLQARYAELATAERLEAYARSARSGGE